MGSGLWTLSGPIGKVLLLLTDRILLDFLRDIVTTPSYGQSTCAMV